MTIYRTVLLLCPLRFSLCYNDKKYERRLTMSFLTVSTDFHIFTWLGAFVLFFIVMRTKQKGTLAHRLLHLFYALIIISGTCLVVTTLNYGHPFVYATKFFLGALLLIVLECIVARKEKQQATATLAIIATLLFIIIASMGLYLPMGYTI